MSKDGRAQLAVARRWPGLVSRRDATYNLRRRWLTAARRCRAPVSINGQRMNKNELLRRISIDPQVCFGKPCIRGHRIWVSLILDLLAAGRSTRDVLENYPGLEEADILACIAYGAEMSRERYVEIEGNVA